ncbi:MAG TPA: hypothetical protein QF695_09320, partial [Arenicellales bacterium]|nr:hypothetical protein [Arenicellales bacterium]
NFSAGLTAEIMSDLSRVEGLRVMLRDRNPDEDVCAAGQRLDAATLLSGSLRRDGERLWVGGQWVNASDCYQIRLCENVISVILTPALRRGRT